MQCDEKLFYNMFAGGSPEANFVVQLCSYLATPHTNIVVQHVGWYTPLHEHVVQHVRWWQSRDNSLRYHWTVFIVVVQHVRWYTPLHEHVVQHVRWWQDQSPTS